MTGQTHSRVVPSSPEIEAAAEGLVARLTSGAAGSEEVAAAREWCNQSAAHAAAFERARRLWHLAGSISAKSAPLRTTRVVRPGAAPRALALAASVLLAVTLAFIGIQNHWTADYRAGRGEQRRIALADGSAVLLDSGAAVDIHFTPARRDVTLLAGQALFTVAHDVSRPFIVHALDLAATDIGTVYAVRTERNSVDVSVQEGEVAVQRARSEQSLPQTLRAGQQLHHAENEDLQEAKTIDINSALAWQRGLLVYNLAPLPEVVDEINRRRPGLIVIANSSLRELKISGVFHLDNLDEALPAIAQAFPIKVTRLTDYLIVLR